MNILIVESENDEYFVQALINSLNQSETTVCKIDDFKYSSLDKKKLTTQIGSALTTRGVSNIGVIIDMDDDSQLNRIALINECLIQAIEAQFGSSVRLSSPIVTTSEFIPIKIDDYTTINFSCYFTNVDGNGELETLLKAIKVQDSTFADCILMGWKNCIEQQGKRVVKKGEAGGDITDKEMLKLWVDFYKRFDTLKKKDRNEDSTDWKGIWLGKTSKKEKEVTSRGKDIFNLDSDVLKEIKEFLLLFS